MFSIVWFPVANIFLDLVDMVHCARYSSTTYLDSKDIGLLMVELSGDIRRLQIEITIYPDSLLFISTFLFASGQFAATELIPISLETIDVCIWRMFVLCLL